MGKCTHILTPDPDCPECNPLVDEAISISNVTKPDKFRFNYVAPPQIGEALKVAAAYHGLAMTGVISMLIRKEEERIRAEANEDKFLKYAIALADIVKSEITDEDVLKRISDALYVAYAKGRIKRGRDSDNEETE